MFFKKKQVFLCSFHWFIIGSANINHTLDKEMYFMSMFEEYPKKSETKSFLYILSTDTSTCDIFLNIE